MSQRLSRRNFLSSSLSHSSCLCALPILSGLIQPGLPSRDPKEVSWLDEIQRRPEAIPANAPELDPVLVDTAGTPIRTLEVWRKRREKIRADWLEFLHPFEVKRDQLPTLTVLEEDRPGGGVIRQLVRYEAEPGQETEAYLLRPSRQTERDRRLPGAVVFHSTVDHSIRQPAGVEGRPEKAFGLQLARRGHVVFCPRNFLWPNNGKLAAKQETARFHEHHAKSKGMAKMLHDARLAVDLLAAQPGVDGKRLGAVGHSLGAKEVLYLAAFDERIKVTVSSEGGIGTQFSNWNAPWYLGDTIGAAFRREHHELLALIAPRAFLLLGGNSADGDRSWPFIASALSVYRLFGKTPRLGLFNHKKGHSVPPEAARRIYEWFAAYL